MRKEIIEQLIAAVTIILIVLGIAYVVSLLLLHINDYEETGKQKLVQELCTRQQYDFCEVQETIYKLKEKTNNE